METTARATFVAASASMSRVLDEAAAVARFDHVPVLIAGESGTGKELVARFIHQESPRARRAFVALNAAALPDTLLEAELFGHVRGAFTGAEQTRKGLLEEADGGSLFLDEVADLSPRAQTVLLRVLQEREYRRLGEGSIRRSNFRLVTATHKSLTVEVSAGRFRADLLFRLDVARVEIPPLRERPEDIVPLVRRFLERWASRLVPGTLEISSAARSLLVSYPWPGNVRELENELTQAAVRAGDRGPIQPEHLSFVRRSGMGEKRDGLRAVSRAFEKNVLRDALASAGGNRTKAARSLGVSRQGLYRKLKRHGILSAPSTLVEESSLDLR